MKKITYVEGDLFKPVFELKGDISVFMPHVCNDFSAWGAGFVVPLGRKIPAAKDAYLDWAKNKKQQSGEPFELGNTQFVVHLSPTGVPIVVCNMIAQHGLGLPRPLRYNALARCLDQVADKALEKAHPVIHAPMFGSALSGGNWNFIEELITDCWLRRAIPVTIYYLAGTLPDNWKLPS